MNKHKHYDVIMAWAEGKPIQFRTRTGASWIDWLDHLSPAWNAAVDYRVKPATMRYRVALLSHGADIGGYYTHACSYEDNERDNREAWTSFVRWLGDWQEVVV